MQTRVAIIPRLLCVLILLIANQWINAFQSRGSPRILSSRSAFCKMDDEIPRDTCKVDITAREDDYLTTRFVRLSASGHDLTPMTAGEVAEEVVYLQCKIAHCLKQLEVDSSHFEEPMMRGKVVGDLHNKIFNHQKFYIISSTLLFL